MSGFFEKNNTKVMTERERYETKYNSARGNLLLVVVFTIINLVLLVTNSDTYFLFSAYVPYFVAGMGMLLCGKYPAEYYEDLGQTEFFGNGVFVGFVSVAVIITLLYLLAWFLSKKERRGWLIFALVIFIIDTVCMFAVNDFAFESIIDIVFHIWVIVSLTGGISACKKMKAIDEEPVFEDGEYEEAQDGTAETQNADSFAKRMADMEEKARVLASAEAFGHEIIYRRVKRVNELVIDGYVYDEWEALIETAHTLSAQFDGHTFVAGYDGRFYSFIEVDGERIAKKARLY